MSDANDVTNETAASALTVTEPNAASRPALRPPVSVGSDIRHLVHFYEETDALTSAVGRFLGEGFAEGDLLIVIVTKVHRAGLEKQLDHHGIDVASACGSGQLTFLDAHETLSKLMRDGEPDPYLFESTVGELVANQAARANGARIRAYGEMVDVLWKQGQRTAAIRLEELWNELQSRHAFTLLCAYAMGSFYKEPLARETVCSTHTHVVFDDGEALVERRGDARIPGIPTRHALTLTEEIAQREQVELALREALREIRRKEDLLRQSEAQHRDFLENATVGLHRVGPDGTILWANRAELDLLGYTADEYVGRPITEFHVDRPVIEDILERLARYEALQNVEARLRARDGSIKHVLISSNVYARNGEFVHTRCFTRDITARRAAEESLRQSELQLQRITDALPVLVAYVDADQRYRFVSATYEKWFGHPKADQLGRRVEDIVGPEAFAVIRPHMDLALSGSTAKYEAELPYQDGGMRSIEATYIPQVDDEGRVVGFVSLVADISERKSFERFRVAATARADRLLKITTAIADAVVSDEVFDAVVDHVAEAVNASSAGLWLVSDDRKSAQLERGIGYTDPVRQSIKAFPLDLTPTVPILDCILRGEPVWLSSQEALLQHYPHLLGTATPGRSYRIACLPLVARGRTLGALGLTLEGTDDHSEDEKAFLVLVARYASQALQRLKLFDEERLSRAAADAAAARMSVLSQVSRVLGETHPNLRTQLNAVVSALGDAMESCVVIWLIESDGLLHLASMYHPVLEAQELAIGIAETEPLEVGEGVTGNVAATGVSVFIPQIDAEELAARAPPSYAALLERFPVYALIASPLRARGEIVGVVTATRIRKGESYTAEDLQLFDELADRAATAVDGGRLHQANLDARSRAEHLYRFAQVVVSATRVEEVFAASLSVMEATLGANRSAILTYGDDASMRFRAWRNLSDAYRSAVEGHSPWARNATVPSPILVGDVERDERVSSFLPIFRQEGIGAVAFIPLVTSGRLLGKLAVYYERPHVWEPHELTTVTALANHLASVIARFAVTTKLEESVRQNELFAGVLAHDLRTPLGAIMMAAQLMLMESDNGGASDRRTDPAKRIVSSGRRMKRMIEELLDFTRARSGGGIEMRRRDTDIAELCAQGVAELKVAHPEWTMRVGLQGDLRANVDPDRLLQVISNVLGNAGQHGQSGGEIVVTLDGSLPDSVRLDVHNEGVIPESLLPHLFDPFRGSSHARSGSGGLGLGLFIVKEIVAAHGGHVSVASTTEAGTTFSIHLPRSILKSEGAEVPA